MAVLSTSANIATPGLPVGSIQAFAGANAPTGWLLCDGSAVGRADYPDLFSAIGTSYGSGNGATTFNLPDLRGRVPAGKDNMGGTAANRLTTTHFGGTATNLGASGGNESHTLTTAQLAVHSHGVSDPGHAHAGDYNVAAAAGGNQSNPANANTANAYNVTRSATTGISIQNSGSGNAHNNTQPTLIVNYIIKAVADIARGGWYTQSSPPAVTQLPTNPSIGEEVLYLTASTGGSLINLRWDGTQWNCLSGGVVLIQTKSFSGASSITFDNVFSSIFKSYRFIGREMFGTTTGGLFWRLRASNSDNSASSYLYTGTYITHGAATGTITGNPSSYAVASWMTTTGDGRVASFQYDLNNPQTATRTSWTGLNSNYDALLTQAGQFANTNQFDGMTFYPGSGGTINGTISIYAYADR